MTFFVKKYQKMLLVYVTPGLLLIPSNAWTSDICASLFSSQTALRTQISTVEISQVLADTFQIQRHGVAQVVPASFNSKIASIEKKVSRLSDKELIETTNFSLEIEHSSKGYLAGLSTPQANIRTLSHLVSELGRRYTMEDYMSSMSEATRAILMREEYTANSYAETTSHWKNFLGNIFSQDIYHILVTRDRTKTTKTVYFDPNEINNHIAIYILHKEVVNRLNQRRQQFLNELKVHIQEPKVFEEQFEKLIGLFTH